MIGGNLFKNCIVYGDDHVVAQLEGWPHSRVFHHIFFKRIHWSMQGAPPGLIIYLRTVDLGKSCHSKVCKYQIITPYFRLRTSLIFPKNSVLVKSLLILNLPWSRIEWWNIVGEKHKCVMLEFEFNYSSRHVVHHADKIGWYLDFGWIWHLRLYYSNHLLHREDRQVQHRVAWTTREWYHPLTTVR